MGKLTQNGVSTTRTNDTYQSEHYRDSDGRNLVQWDYRDKNGKLHSGIAKSEEAAVAKAMTFGYQPVKV